MKHKNLAILLLTLFIVLIFTSCEQPTKVIIHDDNNDGVYHIGSDSGLPGNSEWYIMPWTMQGPAILVINGPGNPVGYQIRNGPDIYFQDQYIGPSAHSFRSGGSLPFNTWLQLNYVIYKSTFLGWLYPVGDLWDVLYNAIVDSTYEWEIKLIYDPDSNELIVEVREPIRLYNSNTEISGITGYNCIGQYRFELQTLDEIDTNVREIIMRYLVNVGHE